MSNNPFDMFGTDPVLEAKGIRIDYGAFWFLISRIDAPNAPFAAAIRSAMKPYRRAIELGEMDDKVLEAKTIETFASTAILGWGSLEHGEGRMTAQDGSAIEFSHEAVLSMLKTVPDLFRDLFTQSRDLTNFRKLNAEEDAKN